MGVFQSKEESEAIAQQIKDASKKRDPKQQQQPQDKGKEGIKQPTAVKPLEYSDDGQSQVQSQQEEEEEQEEQEQEESEQDKSQSEQEPVIVPEVQSPKQPKQKPQVRPSGESEALMPKQSLPNNKKVSLTVQDKVLQKMRRVSVGEMPAQLIGIPKTGEFRVRGYLQDTRYNRKRRTFEQIRSIWDRVVLSVKWQTKVDQKRIDFTVIESAIQINEKYEHKKCMKVMFATTLDGQYIGVANSQDLLNTLRLPCPRTPTKDAFFVEELERQVFVLWQCLRPLTRSDHMQAVTENVNQVDWIVEENPDSILKKYRNRPMIVVPQPKPSRDKLWQLNSDSQEDQSTKDLPPNKYVKSQSSPQDIFECKTQGTKFFSTEQQADGTNKMFPFIATGEISFKMCQNTSKGVKIQFFHKGFVYCLNQQDFTQNQKQFMRSKLNKIRQDVQHRKALMKQQIQLMIPQNKT